MMLTHLKDAGPRGLYRRMVKTLGEIHKCERWARHSPLTQHFTGAMIVLGLQMESAMRELQKDIAAKDKAVEDKRIGSSAIN